MFYNKNSEKLVQVTQTGGCPIPGDIESQAGQSAEQPVLAVGVPVHCRGVGLGDL